MQARNGIIFLPWPEARLRAKSGKSRNDQINFMLNSEIAQDALTDVGINDD